MQNHTKGRVLNEELYTHRTKKLIVLILFIHRTDLQRFPFTRQNKLHLLCTKNNLIFFECEKLRVPGFEVHALICFDVKFKKKIC